MTLRYKLGLTGTKLGCDRAECGACTVLIDDVPHYSCSVLTHTVRGRSFVTIEGLASPTGQAASRSAGRRRRAGLPVRVLPARLCHGSRRVPQDQPQLRRARSWRTAISGNLCRCQDYDKILTALMRGAEYMRRATTMAGKLVGRNYIPPDHVAKVTGRARYAEDFRADGMLFTKLLLSPMPHARVRSIDTSAALGDARCQGDSHRRRSARS